MSQRAFISAASERAADLPPPLRRVYEPLGPEAGQHRPIQLVPPGGPPPSTQSPSDLAGKVPQPSGEGYPVSILLADDNQINQQVGLNLLQRMGYTADLASDGRETMEALRRKRYDLLLLDIQMPFMDGFEVARSVRQQEREAGGAGNASCAPPLVIVAVTANAMHADRERMMAVGMNDCLAKPVNFATFKDTITRWLRYVQLFRSMADKRAVQAPEAAAARSGSPAGREADREPPVDLARFRQIAGPSKAEAQDLRRLFLDRTAELMRQLEQALVEGHMAEAKSLAHKGAGSSGTCGMTALTRWLKETERLSGAGQLANAQTAFEEAQREAESVREFLLREI